MNKSYFSIVIFLSLIFLCGCSSPVEKEIKAKCEVAISIIKNAEKDSSNTYGKYQESLTVIDELIDMYPNEEITSKIRKGKIDFGQFTYVQLKNHVKRLGEEKSVLQCALWVTEGTPNLRVKNEGLGGVAFEYAKRGEYKNIRSIVDKMKVEETYAVDKLCYKLSVFLLKQDKHEASFYYISKVTSPKHLLFFANKFFSKDQPEKALVLLEKAAGIITDKKIYYFTKKRLAQDYFKIAFVYADNNFNEKAKQLVSQGASVLDLDFENNWWLNAPEPEILSTFAGVYLKLGDDQKAATYYCQSTNGNSNNFINYIDNVTELFSRGEEQGVILNLVKAIEKMAEDEKKKNYIRLGIDNLYNYAFKQTSSNGINDELTVKFDVESLDNEIQKAVKMKKWSEKEVKLDEITINYVKLREYDKAFKVINARKYSGERLLPIIANSYIDNGMADQAYNLVTTKINRLPSFGKISPDSKTDRFFVYGIHDFEKQINYFTVTEKLINYYREGGQATKIEKLINHSFALLMSNIKGMAPRWLQMYLCEISNFIHLGGNKLTATQKSYVKAIRNEWTPPPKPRPDVDKIKGATIQETIRLCKEGCSMMYATGTVGYLDCVNACTHE